MVGPGRLSCKETMRFQTPSFEFDPATGEVRRDGTVYRLEPQPAALLALLLSRAGELVPRPEAIRALWGEHTAVNFQEGLDYSVRQIRLALGDRARPPRYVETIPRRGYRFVAPVERSAATIERKGNGCHAGTRGPPRWSPQSCWPGPLRSLSDDRTGIMRLRSVC